MATKRNKNKSEPNNHEATASSKGKIQLMDKISKIFRDKLYERGEDSNIEEALSTVSVDERLKQDYKRKQDIKAEDDNFFLLEAEPEVTVVQETTDENIDEIKSEENKISTLKYFDEEMQGFISNVSKTIIERNNDHLKSQTLFFNGQENTLPENYQKMKFTKEGLFSENKPKVKKYSNHLKNILSHAKNASEWFDCNGDIITEDNPVKESFKELTLSMNENENEEIMTVYCKPQKLGKVPLYKKNLYDDMNSVIILDIKEISFLFHPLFSIETVIASKLEEKFDIYKSYKTQGQSTVLNDKLQALLRRKQNIEKTILKEENFKKKLYKSTDYRQCIKKVTKLRDMRFSELKAEKQIENDILILWKHLKDIRKILSFNNTILNVEIIKTTTDVEQDRKRWEEMFNLELCLSVEQLKCDFIEEKLDYNRKSSDEKKNKLKPIFKYDDEKIRKDIHKQMISALRSPGEPNIVIKLNKIPSIFTKVVTDNMELKRRSEIEKIKLFFKIYANEKEVCKSKMVHLDSNFKAVFDEVFFLQLGDNITNIKIIVFEQNYIRTSHSISEILIEIPRKNSSLDNLFKSVKFDASFKRKYAVGVGNCKTVSEIVKTKYPQLKELDMTIYDNEPLVAEGVFTFNIIWDEYNKSMEKGVNRIANKQNLQSSEIYQQQPVSKILKLLFEKMLDPNDPDNAFLFKFMKNYYLEQVSFENFYFEESLYMKFKTDKIHAIEDRKNLKFSPDVDFDRGSVTSRDTYSRKLDNDEFKKYSIAIATLLDPLELQRKMSKKYLELMNDHLTSHCQASFTDKNLSDIMTAFKYPGLRSITIDFLRPKQPLFYQTKSENSPKLSHSNIKDYYLKVCVLKAFQLPNRIYQVQPTLTQDEDALKLVTLRPFIHINCQGKNQRTLTVLGSNPTWNEQLILPISFNMKSSVVINLFDELYEDLLDDDRLEKSTIHYRYNTNWLASLKISLSDMFAQNKIEGTFGMSTPPELLSYKYSIEGKRSSLHIHSDQLKRDLQARQREGIFISLRLEIFPSMTDSPKLMSSSIESNEMDYVVKYLKFVSEVFMNQFPNRKCNLLIVDTSGKTICITRFLQPLVLPEFGECLKHLFSLTIHHEESQSSKASTPSKRKASKGRFEKDELSGRNMQSTFSLNEGRRFSKSTKDTFELKSVDENFFDSIENDMSYKMQMCSRYVSLIPLYENNSRLIDHVTLLGMQTIKLVTGSIMDHTILLMSYFIQLGIDCWLLSGMALPRGYSTYVLVRECNNAIQLKNDKRYPVVMKSNVKHFIYDAIEGVKYDVKDPFCPLQSVHFVCNQENIWLNIQAAEQSDFVRYNFTNTSDWRPVFQKNKMACPGPLSGTVNSETLYNYDIQDTKRLKEAIEQKVKIKIDKWRGHRKTSWNRYCSSVLHSTLMDWEKYNLIPFSTKPKPQNQMQQLLLSYQVFGFPLNFPYSNLSNILSSVKGTQIHMDDRNDIEYALGVEVFPYPNGVYSIWVYIATVAKKI